MTKREYERRELMFRALESMGLTREEAESLRRISVQLGSWHERLCCEDIEERNDGSAWLTRHHMFTKRRTFQIPNRGAGAERRLAKIMAPHRRRLWYYVQRDPRGAAVYVGHKSKLRKAGKKLSDLDSCYTMGNAVW